MIRIGMNPDREALAREAKPFVQRLSDKVARAAPDQADTATPTYVFMRRLLAKAAEEPGVFEFIAGNEAANATVNELRSFFNRFSADRPALKSLMGSLVSKLMTQKEEIRERDRAERQRAARRDLPTVREQRGLRRQSEPDAG